MTDEIYHREEVVYTSGARTFRSVMLIPPQTGDAAARPLVMVAPNWLGMTEDSERRAVRFAGDGSVVLLVDMYGDGHRVTGGMEEAAGLANALRANFAERRRRMQAAMEAFTDAAGRRGLGDTGKLACIGFCFGGGNALELARTGAKLRGVVSVHGDLTTSAPAAGGTITAPVLILHGAADPVEPAANRAAIEAELADAGVCWRMHLFGAAVHSFTEADADVPGVAEFDAAATEESLLLTRNFLAANFKD